MSELAKILGAGDLLLSPRISGDNTPMKVYSYLHSGTPTLATRLPTHTQVMDDEVALLTEATPKAYGEGLVKLVEDKALRDSIGSKAKTLANSSYTPEVFDKKLKQIYSSVTQRLSPKQGLLSTN